MIKIFKAEEWVDYELLDTGDGEKLERVGKYLFVRPFENAFWPKTMPVSDWANTAGKFLTSKEGKAGWQIFERLPEKWGIQYKGIKFLITPTPFRHFGFFPEQASHWNFIEEKINLRHGVNKKKVKFLNLFGYTGVGSLFALRAGAEVTHVDASRQSLNWAKENQQAAGLAEMPMRVIEDDAVKFLEREVKRGNKYDAIVLDPPKFGRGPKGEIWKIEKDLPKLLKLLPQVLSDTPLFVILTSYAIDSSSLSLSYALAEALKSKDGIVDQGELCLKETSKSRLIPLANTAVWAPA